jgi:uridine kinase
VGISGIDTSGKTLFANGFLTYLRSRGRKAHIVNLDDFHNPKKIRYEGDDEAENYLTRSFDLKTLENEVLKPITERGSLDKELDLLDVLEDTYTLHRHFRIEPGSFVLLEGVFLFRPPTLNYLDYRIYLDVGFETALRRAGGRDVPIHGRSVLQKYHSKYLPAQKRYMQEFLPRERAHAIVDNNDHDRPSVRFADQPESGG